MGIAPYKTFTFDGESSATYGVYLTGEGVFDAPERDVEMLDVPGRNGAYVQDKGKFKNIKVTYKAGMFDVNESNFADKMSAFRNWLCSKKGYVRLEDEYNPNEYRMAVYYSGVEVEHEDLFAGQFEVTFECKPQRFLTSGETEQTVTSGGTLTNPTLFESSPLLAVEGYGNIAFNGADIEINDIEFGNVQISDDVNILGETSITTDIDINICNLGDVMYSPHYNQANNNYIAEYGFYIKPKEGYKISGATSIRQGYITPSGAMYIGTAWSKTVTNTVTTFYITPLSTGNTYTATASVGWTVQYDGNKTVSMSVSVSTTPATAKDAINFNFTKTLKSLWCDSTASALGHPTYIDCDIGECYLIRNGEIVTLNNTVALGSDLPKLSSGTNTFTFDNTITSLKVTPRYWKV